MIEVEVKLEVKDPVNLKEKLLKEGFRKGKCVKEEDFYFNSSQHDFRKSDEALRIRSVQNLDSGEAHAFLTYKGPKLDQVSMTRKELETGIESVTVMQEMLRALGFDKKYPVVKTREYFHKACLTACVDQVEMLGSFLELEILAEAEEEREAALFIIEETLKKLGNNREETTRTSYLTMLMEQERIAE